VTAGPAALAQAVRVGDRRALARGITLVESTRPDHREQAEELLRILLPYAGRAVRVGVSGTPGVGKSTLIEALGLLVLDRGHRLAVLAIDPSSARSGGSILGDKTRMAELARRDEAFIRPSPSGETLGGVARRTREAMVLCEAAGADVVFVETVGVGQSETAVAAMTDLFLLLVAPGGGDELQGIKRGIMELADVVAVNKADGDLLPAANRAVAAYRGALQLMTPRHRDLPGVALPVSSVEGTGLDGLWDELLRRRSHLEAHGELAAMRAGQARDWMWTEVREGLIDRTRHIAGDLAAQMERAVGAGHVLPHVAAARILEHVLRDPRADR